MLAARGVSPRLSTMSVGRGLSSAVHFYANRQLELYAAKEANRLTLRQLVRGDLSSLLSSMMKLRPGLFRPVNERGKAHQGE